MFFGKFSIKNLLNNTRYKDQHNNTIIFFYYLMVELVFFCERCLQYTLLKNKKSTQKIWFKVHEEAFSCLVAETF